MNATHATGDGDRVRRLPAEGIRVDDRREGEASPDTRRLAVHPGRPVSPADDFRMADGTPEPASTEYDVSGAGAGAGTAVSAEDGDKP
ncbi:hypothetical protein E6W39_03020 [Kitasatospora acidiphila]|uniref:Uncharacterized protein n=1 Tax=Kitasatospora acidiphila TaxID=2567942 RepID=A0A540VXE0_9ACTN|nr:hypothetical protein [Kitasatospora acidiphila]TQF01397.1 hypothetical protein E6W39_03020 [Kitasatospora acidiphila]